jgi:hypothetical protein
MQVHHRFHFPSMTIYSWQQTVLLGFLGMTWRNLLLGGERCRFCFKENARANYH